MAVVLDREELAWAAGLFDGEGYIGCTLTHKNYKQPVPMLQMTVVQWHNPEVLLRFQRAVGGGFMRQRTVRGSMEYTWRSGAFEVVQAAIALLWRWLSSPKRAQIAESFRAYYARRASLGIRQGRRRKRQPERETLDWKRQEPAQQQQED